VAFALCGSEPLLSFDRVSAPLSEPADDSGTLAHHSLFVRQSASTPTVMN